MRVLHSDRFPKFRPGRCGRPSHGARRLLGLGVTTMAVGWALAAPASAQICGDINQSGTVTSSDAQGVLRHAVGQDVELVCGGDCITLEARLVDTENALAEAQAQLAEVQALLAGLSRTEDTLILSGANLQIVDGTGATAGPTNGLGNLIVGYNEATLGQEHTGSHNLVVGAEHEYSSFSGIVAGESNTISARGASVLGGIDNQASGLHSAVCGGNLNEASGANAVVAGGSRNSATGLDSSVGGGYLNDASGTNAAVSGGCENEATSIYSAVSGGRLALASGAWSSVTGGFTNSATAQYSTVSGGSTRAAGTQYRWTGGSLSEAQ